MGEGSNNLEYGWIFAYLNGGRGPNGMAMDRAGNLYAAHHSAREVLVFNWLEDSMVPNNLQFHGGIPYITEADQRTVWRVQTKIPGVMQFQDR